MAQIFRPRANVLARVAMIVALLLLALPLVLGFAIVRSPYATGAGATPDQPVPFSHAQHVGGLGIDCRYCHTAVEQSAYAGMPPTETCMTCHAQLWSRAAMLQPVRDSFAGGKPLRWTRVYDLPDFVYFNHGIHVAKGVACVTCHGRVDRMPVTRQTGTLFMAWCLDCHRAPERFIRPREQAFAMDWQPPEQQLAQGRSLKDEYGIRTEHLTNCYTCHR